MWTTKVWTKENETTTVGTSSKQPIFESRNNQPDVDSPGTTYSTLRRRQEMPQGYNNNLIWNPGDIKPQLL